MPPIIPFEFTPALNFTGSQIDIFVRIPNSYVRTSAEFDPLTAIFQEKSDNIYLTLAEIPENPQERYPLFVNNSFLANPSQVRTFAVSFRNSNGDTVARTPDFTIRNLADSPRMELDWSAQYQLDTGSGFGALTPADPNNIVNTTAGASVKFTVTPFVSFSKIGIGMWTDVGPNFVEIQEVFSSPYEFTFTALSGLLYFYVIGLDAEGKVSSQSYQYFFNFA